MIAVQTSQLCECQQSWQHTFAEMLPEIEIRLRSAFAHFDAERRDESTQNGCVLCLLAYLGLFGRGHAERVTPANLVWYAVLQVNSGREAGGRLNAREPLSRYAQYRNRIRVEPLSSRGETRWIDLIVADKHASVADQVAARLDIRAWLAQLARRTRQIASDLALGFSTSEVASRFGISACRVSQIRRELEASWHDFQQESRAGVG